MVKKVMVILIFNFLFFPKIFASLGPSSLTGESLLKDCEEALKFDSNENYLDQMNKYNVFQMASCNSYIAAFNDSHFMFALLGNSEEKNLEAKYKGYFFCPPKNMTISQEKKIITKYLNDTPKDWHKPAYPVIIHALSKTFPCKKV